ncbi:MAG: adenylate/guanylate cyclase domain-containing protein [Chitinophagales bacterium]
MVPLQAQQDAQKLEEMRKLQKQMQEENKMLQQQQEWNNQNAQQEIKKLNNDNQQKTFEVQQSKQTAQQALAAAAKAKADLDVKMAELAATQSKIDSAKAELAFTDSLLQTSEMVNKRITQEKQRQEDSIRILKKDQELTDLELNAQKAKNNLYIIIAAVSLSLLTIIGVLFVARQKTMRELADKNKVIQEEKKRSDELLLNILPEEVMHELKAHGKTQARNYSNATVLFADIKEFTKISERLSPDDLIEALDAYFERFDHVIAKYGIEKIKTIGDAYVCAGGVPSKNEVSAHAMVSAALEFMHEVDRLREERSKIGKQTFEFRIGMHTGQLIAGVVGIRKFAYDIWGDTVNMAARMQQESEAGKVNISGATYELVKDKFACVYRGKHEAKNKGEIDMYFVEKAIAS